MPPLLSRHPDAGALHQEERGLEIGALRHRFQALRVDLPVHVVGNHNLAGPNQGKQLRKAVNIAFFIGVEEEDIDGLRVPFDDFVARKDCGKTVSTE